MLDFFHFRRADNNPVAVDDVVVDRNTISRSTVNLPSGHTYAANANRLVAEALGFTNTQAVMYSVGSRGRVFTGLSADDVSTVKYANAGADRLATTTDDYTVALRYQASCTNAQVRVQFAPLTTDGDCVANVQVSYDQSGEPFVFHQTLIKQSSPPYIEIRLDESLPPLTSWDFGAHIFSAEGEAGDLREWDAVFP